MFTIFSNITCSSPYQRTAIVWKRKFGGKEMHFQKGWSKFIRILIIGFILNILPMQMSNLTLYHHVVCLFLRKTPNAVCFLAHLSWKSSSWCCRLSACLTVFNCTHFWPLLQNHWSSPTKLGTKHRFMRKVEIFFK